MGDRGPLLLVGDIGGTKTDLAIVSWQGGPRARLAQRRFVNRDYQSLEEIVQTFFTDTGLRAVAACFDVAGPVDGGSAQLTNLPWHLREPDMAEALGMSRVKIINDLVAMAAAIPLLQPDELDGVQPGEPQAGGAIAVLAPGTGLGEAFLTYDGAGYQPQPSEGGHAAFAPASDLELELLRYLWGRFEHVSFERVVSGIGIPNLYEFLRERGGIPESLALAAALASAEERTRVIVEAATAAQPDPLAEATVQLFLHALGTEAANLALKVLATGGIYLAGGLVQRLRDEIPASGFREAMLSSGRFRTMMERVPVAIVKGEVALLGVASEGLRLLRPEIGRLP